VQIKDPLTFRNSKSKLIGVRDVDDINGNLRELLSDELDRRSKANPQYSMRSFAMHLGISPSYLLRLLRGNHRISKRTLLKLIERLPIEKPKADYFLSNYKKPTRNRAFPTYAELSREQLQVMGHWLHYAILALLDLPEFKPDPNWIAHRLNVTVEAVREAWDLIVRIGMIAQNDQKRWVQTTGPHLSTLAIPGTSKALKNLQLDFLELSKMALMNCPIEERSHSGLTVAFDSRQIDFIKTSINRLRKSLHQRIRKCSKEPDSVYQVSISFFPLSEQNR